MKKLLWAIIVVLLIALIFTVRKNTQLQNQEQAHADTIIIYDTIQYITPQPKDSGEIGSIIRKLPIARNNKKVVNSLPDSFENSSSFWAVSDSLFIVSEDSVLVEIPIVQTVYEDSLYKAYVSGYNAKLDSFYVYPSTTVVTRYIEPKNKRISLSIQAGVGLDGLYFGLGISYNLVYLGK